MINQNPCNIIIIIFMSVNCISKSGPFQPSKSMLVIFHVLLISLSVCLSTHTLLYSKYEHRAITDPWFLIVSQIKANFQSFHKELYLAVFSNLDILPLSLLLRTIYQTLNTQNSWKSSGSLWDQGQNNILQNHFTPLSSVFADLHTGIVFLSFTFLKSSI